MTSDRLSISEEAYNSIFLHCVKYPSNNILGLLAGSSSDCSTSGYPSSIKYAFPVFHFWSSLFPMLEIAAEKVALHCQSISSDLKIVGLYYGDMQLRNSKEKPSSTTVFPHIVAHFENLIRTNASFNLTPIVNYNLITLNDMCYLEVYKLNPKTRTWTNIFDGTEGSNSGIDDIISQKSLPDIHRDLSKMDLSTFHDFDDHLQNPELDWL